MSISKTVEVDLGHRSYPVYVGSSLLDQIGEYARLRGLGKRALVVTNELVGNLYGQRVKDSLQAHGVEADWAFIPDGETYKTVETAASVYDACVQAKLDRGSFIVALGGGVIGDIAGFVAATYMRGIDFVQVPTTLLAQVDASVGGKTGVNHASAKNLVGAFHQPRFVVADIDTLKSLDPRDYRAGLAEVVKHGLIADSELFAFVEREGDGLLRLDPKALAHVVVRSIEIKAEVVKQDEKESGLRAILNFGHTVGHGIEAAMGYELLHGEAIAIGMHVEARLTLARGNLKPEEFSRLVPLLARLELPTKSFPDKVEAVFSAMTKDKKAQDGRLRFALLDGIGRAAVVDDIPIDDVKEAYLEAAT